MEHYDWNDGWLFTPVFDPAIVRPECPELTLEPVRLPHTVKALPYNYCNENDYQKLSGYRREFFAPKEWEGRTVLLTFGAVAHDATVFCNGRRLFHHGCGYTAFTVDLTSALHLGKKNVVAVRCDSREDLNIPPFGGQLDGLTDLSAFADKLEAACFETLGDGIMTKDLVGLVDEGTPVTAVNSSEFIGAIHDRLAAKL